MQLSFNFGKTPVIDPTKSGDIEAKISYTLYNTTEDIELEFKTIPK